MDRDSFWLSDDQFAQLADGRVCPNISVMRPVIRWMSAQSCGRLAGACLKFRREPIRKCQAKTALDSPLRVDMSQLRPLSLIAIVAWSLVVCLGVSAQAAGNRDQAGNRDNAAYIEQPGAPNPNYKATQVQQGLGNSALITPFSESDLPQTPPPPGYYGYQGQIVPGYVPSTQGLGLGLGPGLGMGGRNR
jgi:hypothetical protein